MKRDDLEMVCVLCTVNAMYPRTTFDYKIGYVGISTKWTFWPQRPLTILAERLVCKTVLLTQVSLHK